MNAISLMILFLFQAVSSVGTSNVPDSPGVYVRKSGAEWIKLQQANVIEGKTKGLDAYLMTDGYTNLNMSVVYQGAKAPLRIAEAKPVFFVRETGAANNLSVIRLERKKDQRTFRAAPSAAMVGNSLGFKKSQIVKMAVVKNPDGSILITPEEALKPGEYLILFDKIAPAYDFGVD
jgi:hypothetical protein